jgi:hypothetical protein
MYGFDDRILSDPRKILACRMDEVLRRIELLALVLAHLPMSKQKVRLLLVSKLWQEALVTPAAHSPETSDCTLPFAGYGISRQVTRALSRYTVIEDETLVGWDRTCRS